MAGDEIPEWHAELYHLLREGGERLDLKGRSLGAAGAAVVAEELPLSAVRNLHLDSNGIGDQGAASIAELLGAGASSVEVIYLQLNDIGRDGIEALATALKRNSTLRGLHLSGNKGVDPNVGTEAEAAPGIEALISAIGVNTTLEAVEVGDFNPQQNIVDAALADTERRRLGRGKFLAGSVTKAAHKTD
jgi:pimeloyl-ACP methyl ester carboxylesterase